MTTNGSRGISAALRGRVLRRLGLDNTPPPEMEGLREVYGAWSRRVPFDNVRKMIALAKGAALPGRDAADFLEAWMETGAGGTCWPGSIALDGLLRSLGFRARLATGSMHDVGVPNHGTVIVTLETGDYLADSSLLTYEPVPLAGSLYTYDDGVTSLEVEPDAGSHVVWTRGPHQSSFLPCRIFPGEASHGFVLARYENSRLESPFNQRLYALRRPAAGTTILRGGTIFERTAEGVCSRDLTPEELCDSLHADIGVSRELIKEWAGCGALAASYEAPPGSAPPRPRNVPPSQRRQQSGA